MEAPQLAQNWDIGAAAGAWEGMLPWTRVPQLVQKVSPGTRSVPHLAQRSVAGRGVGIGGGGAVC